jgi:hypothetical protein
LIDILLVSLIVMPFPAALSALYFWWLWRQARNLLALLLALLATVGLLSGAWIGVATFSLRFLGRPFPPEVLPITILAIQASEIMMCISAFMLWRANGTRRK